MNIRFQYVILLSLMMMMSCHKDTETFTSEVIKVHTPLVVKEISGTVIGYVYDEKNLPVADADVMTYSAATKTNQHGAFIFENVRLDEQGTYIRIAKNGWFHASDFIYPVAQSTTYSYTRIYRLENEISMDASSGGAISISGGAKVIFPSGAISDHKGSNYSGMVKIYSKYLHPDDRDLGHKMPGGLIADAANGNTVALGTLGMVAVELRDPQGNLLQIARGKKATIEFPVNTTYKPSEIPLWSFDEVKGRWKEEGKAMLSGNKYIGEVTHFSFWNIDAPFPLIDVCGKVVNEDGSPAPNLSVKVEAEGIGTHFGVTNSKGEFCGKMPKGKRLRIIAFYPACKNDISEVNVGPFDVKTVLDNIKIKSLKSFKIKGKIQCNNNVVSNGIAVIKIKESSLIIKAESDGSINADISSFLCGEDVPVTVFAFDNKTSETSPSINVTTTNAQNLILNVCASAACDLKADMVYDCNKTITANISGGSGNYTYAWKDNAGKDKSLVFSGQDSIFESKTYCVTVKDVTNNCEKTFCKEVGGKLVAGIEADCENGKLYVYVRGGVQSIKYNWSDGSTDKDFKAPADGKYCVTITDGAGCTTSICEEISKSINLSNSAASCSKNIYNITSGPFESGKVLGSGLSGNQDLTFPIKIDVFKTGFNFGIQLKSGKCTIVKQYKLPQLIQGVTFNIVNTTCSNCTDGKINITVNNNASCNECKIGDIKIFKTDDIATDLSTDNTNGKMAKGEYYVVITDAVSGCYVSVNKVKVN